MRKFQTTYDGMNQVKESKIELLLREYEFVWNENEGKYGMYA